MGAEPGKIGHELLAVARETRSATAFSEELSGIVNRWIPHDRYLISGVDPATGASCMWLADRGYLAELTARLHRIDAPLYWYGLRIADSSGPAAGGAGGTDRGPRPLVGRTSSRAGQSRRRLVVPLTDRGHVLGSLTLVRPDAHPFGDDDVTRAGALAAPLAQAFRQFVAGDVLRPPVRASAPGVVMLGSDHAILGITQTARDSLRVLWPNDPQVDDRKLVGVLWNSVYLARQTGRRAVSRIPTPDGWLAVHAEPFESADPGAVAVTVEPALGEELLPVLAAWYRVTPAELGVVRQATGGLAAKQIARKLDLSLHTVNDHLRSVYRKTGAAGRDELLARLGPA